MISTPKQNILTTLLTLLLLAYSNTCFAFTAEHYTNESRLSSGKWVKIKISESGVHAITQSDISKWGFSDISKIKIFGYGGAPISETLTAENYIDDLPLVPVIRANNKIYFYAQGHITWQDGKKVPFSQTQHPYANAAYYFVTENSEIPDAELSQSEKQQTNSNNIVDTFTDFTFHESELVSTSETGRQLLGEDFKYKSTQSFKFSIPGYVDDTQISVLTAFAANTEGGDPCYLTFKYNGTQLASLESDRIDPVISEYQHVRINNFVKTFKLKGDDEFTYSINLNYGGTLNAAHLDYITVNYTRRMELLQGKLGFRHKKLSNESLRLHSASEATHIWDVTNPALPISIATETDENGVTFTPTQTGNREYVAFNEDATLPTPEFAGNIKNQNIHGEATPDMIIITPSQYAAQANRLAALHQTNDAMRVLVINHDLIFNEFSSGTPDAMAYRKLCKLFYDRGADAEGHKLKYLLLFGRGSFDNRQLTTVIKSNPYPMLLTYQTVESSNENTSYTTDDIFVMLEDNATSMLNNICSIAVGRLPIKSVGEAKSAVDKLYKYVNTPNYGTWKTNAIIIADDQNQAIHMKQAESIINLYNNNGGGNNIFNRVYIDAYETTSNGGRRVSEIGRTKFFNSLNEGALWLSYIGHANPSSWTEEGLLSYTDMNNMYNKRWPFLLAATCEFARFDANVVSGGEIMLNNPNGGVIAELATTRLVYIPNNGSLNNSIARYAFARDENGKHYTIGEFVRLGKNELKGEDNKLRYVLLGDPALRLKYPENEAVIDAINGYEIGSDDMPTFQARQNLTFTGRIVGSDGNTVNDFNGAIVSTLFDAEKSIETKGYGEDGEKYVFQERDNRLAIVTDSVSNGQFSINITVPSELTAAESFENYSPARLFFYAYNSNNGSEASGSNDQFYIYGYDENVKADSIGPDIRIFALNNETFEDGDNINESPLVIANIFDENGINFSNGGIGHNITLQLDEKNTFYDVASFFTPTFDSDGNSGVINYQLSDLTPGEHTLRLKVWDVFNNSSEKHIKFNVVKGLKPELFDVYATPNPASTEASFFLKHNRPDAVLTITIQVFDLMGRLVWSTTETGKSDLYTSFPITWNLCDLNGSRVSRGIYVYKATISADGKEQATKAKKIAVTGL